MKASYMKGKKRETQQFLGYTYKAASPTLNSVTTLFSNSLLAQKLSYFPWLLLRSLQVSLALPLIVGTNTALTYPFPSVFSYTFLKTLLVSHHYTDLSLSLVPFIRLILLISQVLHRMFLKLQWQPFTTVATIINSK